MRSILMVSMTVVSAMFSSLALAAGETEGALVAPQAVGDSAVPAGGICASTYQICTDTSNSIMLLNNENVSVRSICQGYDSTHCSGSHMYYISTDIRQLK